MIKIEVTGNSVGEVADKLMSLAANLMLGTTPEGKVTTPIGAIKDLLEKPKAKKAAKKVEAEVAEEAPVDPTPVEAEKPAEPAPEPAPSTTADTNTAAPAPSASEPTLDFEKDVAPVVIEAVARVGREGVSSTLAEFGAERASEVDPSQYGELVKALEAL